MYGKVAQESETKIRVIQDRIENIARVYDDNDIQNHNTYQTYC